MGRHANYKDRTRRGRRETKPTTVAEPAPISAKFGLCPHCRRPAEIFVRVGRDAWLGCPLHRVRFYVCNISAELRGPGAKPESILNYAETSPVFSSETHPARLAESV
jgi:hypothetical protein